MSFHFLNGTVYGGYSDTGPGTITVDRFANILDNQNALLLSAGPWTVNINGSIRVVNGYGIHLLGTGFVSNIRIGPDATVSTEYFGAIFVEHAANITNAGGVFGRSGISVDVSDQSFTIRNLKSGVIEAEGTGLRVQGLGVHTIDNAGTISGGEHPAIAGDNGTEKITNWGIVNGAVSTGGAVSLGSGADSFTNFKKVGNVIKDGIVNGTIDLGAGNDIFNGGSTREVVFDNYGRDTINLGDGPDHFFGSLREGDLVDTIDGGKAIDAYDASQSGASEVVINLDTVRHTDNIYGRTIAATRANDVNNAVTPWDIVRGCENAYGTAGADSMFGTKGSNELAGGAGADHLYGLAGKDRLFGGTDPDTFVFTSLTHSGPGKADRDTIFDFEGGGVAGGDLIDLSVLNASIFLGTNANFSGNAGALRAVWVGAETIVQLDTNGDRRADFSIAISGNLTLVGEDFVL